MTTVLLIRHGRTTANSAGVLAGWTSGVRLDETGEAQVESVARRLVPVPLAAVVSSPLERCQQTARSLIAQRDGQEVTTDERLGECRYGDWNGARIDRLATDSLWEVVQQHPSGAGFPGDEGESLRDTQHRAVSAVRDWNSRLGEDAVYAVCSHGDVLKAVIADAVGMHLDLFQRIQVDPGSLTVIRYTRLRPFLCRLNDRGGDVSDLVPRQEADRQAKRRRWWPGRRRAWRGARPQGGEPGRDGDRGPGSRAGSGDAVIGGGSG